MMIPKMRLVIVMIIFMLVSPGYTERQALDKESFQSEETIGFVSHDMDIYGMDTNHRHRHQDNNKNENNSNNGTKKTRDRDMDGSHAGDGSRARRMIDSDGSLSSSDKQSMLADHNNYRSALALENGDVKDSSGTTYAAASNMNYLFWDEALALTAETHSAELAAASCNGWYHSDKTTRKTRLATYIADGYGSFTYDDSSVGENIGVTWSSSSTQKLTRYTDRIDDWWDEDGNWAYTSSYSSCSSCSSDVEWGHFTQMAWAETRYIGCGVAYCYDGSYWNKWYVTCNYWPAGNYIGSAAWTQGTSASACEGDRTSDASTGLCGGCMDPDFTASGSTSSASDCNDGFEDVGTNTNTPSPTSRPTTAPSDKPTSKPTSEPTKRPTDRPTAAPASDPTAKPTSKPTASPTARPTNRPTSEPTDKPTSTPTIGSDNVLITSWASSLSQYWFAIEVSNVADGYALEAVYFSNNDNDWLLGEYWSTYRWYFAFSSRTGSGWALNYNVKLVANGEEIIANDLITSFDYSVTYDFGNNFGGPTANPTTKPTSSPSSKPTGIPTSKPTASPSNKPTANPTTKPTGSPTDKPTGSPTNKPTNSPTDKPSSNPTLKPTVSPTDKPTSEPTTASPTSKPTGAPTDKPSTSPTDKPSQSPTNKPTISPTDKPSVNPTDKPSVAPSDRPTAQPTNKPSDSPTTKPTANPTSAPINTATGSPTSKPSVSPTNKPTESPSARPTIAPTEKPTGIPSDKPTGSPTEKPSGAPTNKPSVAPSVRPTASPVDTVTPPPTSKPSVSPSAKPTVAPTDKPSTDPTSKPTGGPTDKPTASPSNKPTGAPTDKPSANPTARPTVAPTQKPSGIPTARPTAEPTNKPTVAPLGDPDVNENDATDSPTSRPTIAPTQKPTDKPTSAPTDKPTSAPTSTNIQMTIVSISSNSITLSFSNVADGYSVKKVRLRSTGAAWKDDSVDDYSAEFAFDNVFGTDFVYPLDVRIIHNGGNKITKHNIIYNGNNVAGTIIDLETNFGTSAATAIEGTVTYALIGIGGLVVVVLIIVLILFVCKRRQKVADSTRKESNLADGFAINTPTYKGGKLKQADARSPENIRIGNDNEANNVELGFSQINTKSKVNVYDKNNKGGKRKNSGMTPSSPLKIITQIGLGTPIKSPSKKKDDSNAVDTPLMMEGIGGNGNDDGMAIQADDSDSSEDGNANVGGMVV